MNPTPKRRQGPLKPRTEEETVVVKNPPADPMHMSADEADLSRIRMLEAAEKAREADPLARAKSR